MEISASGETLFAALEKAAKGLARIEIDTVLTAFLAAFPQWQGQTDRRERLSALLNELAQVNRLRLPSNKRQGWEPLPAPPSPKWIAFVREQPPAKQALDHRSFPWVSELAFAARLKALPNVEELLRIHEFLKNNGEKRPIVPVKERSLQIFGDEKRLDALRKTKLFASDRLTLELLRCRDVPASLPCVPSPLPSQNPWLIVENEATFHTFARLNRVLALHSCVQAPAMSRGVWNRANTGNPSFRINALSRHPPSTI